MPTTGNNIQFELFPHCSLNKTITCITLGFSWEAFCLSDEDFVADFGVTNTGVNFFFSHLEATLAAGTGVTIFGVFCFEAFGCFTAGLFTLTVLAAERGVPAFEDLFTSPDFGVMASVLVATGPFGVAGVFFLLNCGVGLFTCLDFGDLPALSMGGSSV